MHTTFTYSIDYDTIRNKIIVVSTKIGAKSNGIYVSLLNSNQEEADTLLILHALYACQRAEKITIITPDTDVFIVALQKYPLLGPKVFQQLGTGCKGKEIHLEPIIINIILLWWKLKCANVMMTQTIVITF